MTGLSYDDDDDHVCQLHYNPLVSIAAAVARMTIQIAVVEMLQVSVQLTKSL